MPTFLERARLLDPIFPYSDEDAALIHDENEKLSKRVDALLAQLRSGNLRNVEEASVIHDFYMFSMAMMDCSRFTFPDLTLGKKINNIFPLLPREFRTKVTMTDLTDKEIEKAIKRVSKRFDLGDEPFLRTKKPKRLTS